PVPAQDQHGEFGQVVAGEVVDLTAGEHLAHGREPVAVEPGAVRDPDASTRTTGSTGSRGHARPPFRDSPVRPNQPTGRLSGTAGVTSRIPLRCGCARAVPTRQARGRPGRGPAGVRFGDERTSDYPDTRSSPVRPPGHAARHAE